MSAQPIPYLDALVPSRELYVLCDAPHASQPVRCTRRAKHAGAHQGWRADPSVAPEDMVPIVWGTTLEVTR
jgi:hypothetical protein